VFFNDGDDSLKDIFEQFDPNGTGSVDYISWSMCLTPKDLPLITKQCREVGPLALATPTEEEIELIEAMYERGRELGTEAAKVGTRLLIDAEQVRFQPAIDNLVLDLQQTFNARSESDKPIIYNTYQCYLKDAMERLTTDVQRADRLDYHFGAKLVRGAYMESERALATANGLVSPIHETVEDTHTCYNDAVGFLLEHSTKTDKQIELMVASHNKESIENAIDVMKKYGIDRQSSIICFAQLYGMADNLSFNLGRHGYRAYKYVPYGAVHEVMPYLLRRARENSAIVGGAAAEAAMIGNELKRRLRSPFKTLLTA
jgi:proline dehydrogenase